MTSFLRIVLLLVLAALVGGCLGGTAGSAPTGRRESSGARTAR